MTSAQMLALLAYIDAAIDAAAVKHSCGPHVSSARRFKADARRELQEAFGL